MFYKSILALVLLLGVFSSANALELDIEDNKKPNYLLGFFVVEAILGVNAWMASEAPNEYGTITLSARSAIYPQKYSRKVTLPCYRNTPTWYWTNYSNNVILLGPTQRPKQCSTQSTSSFAL